MEAVYLLQMCVDTLSSCLIRYREARPLSLSLSVSFLSHTCPLSLPPFPLMPPLPVAPFRLFYLLPLRNFTCPPHESIFFPPLPVQKRKTIQTMEMITYQLLVAISSRLPQSQIGPQIKCKTETHAYCIWMLIPFHEIPNRFWHGDSRGPSFMYILRFMKFQHMIKVDLETSAGTDCEIQIASEVS